MSRPSGKVTLWATDTLYPAGPNDWNETPTKIKPPDSKIARGFEPSERPAPMFLNYALNKNGAFIDYLDGIEVLNWGDVYDTPNVTAAIVFDPVKRLFWAAGTNAGDSVIAASFLGKKWYVNTDYPGAPITGGFTDAACSTDTDQTVVFIGIDNTVVRIVNDAWPAVTTLLGSVEPWQCVIWDVYRTKFWIGADYVESDPDTAGDLIGSNNATATAWTHFNQPRTGAYDGPITNVCASPEFVLTLRGVTGGANLEFALTTDGSGFDIYVFNGDDGLPTITADVNGAAYSAADSLFMFLTDDGKVYTCDPSTIAGVPTWELAADTGKTWIEKNALTCLGSVWLACELFDHGIGSGDRHVLTYSLDKGATWNPLPNPLEEGTTPQYVIVRVGNTGADGRFYVVSNGVTTSTAAFSLRTRG